MFTFVHTYAQDVFPALVKSGLWRRGDGLKLMHKPGFEPPHDFNTAAAVGSPLEKLLHELRCPFYIDRLQGGLGYTNVYPYSKALLSHYSELLGDDFWGFQMHEWASNFRSDETRIRELCEREGVSTGDPTALSRLWGRVLAGELPLFLEAYPAEEWQKRVLSDGLSSFLTEADRLYTRRVFETGGLLFPADSYYMALRTELSAGAKRLMPEAGWQIPNLRAQIAFTRGQAKSAGVPWGIYYECWQNTNGFGFTVPYSLRSGQDEWQEDLLHKGNGSGLDFEKREHGGSSLSLLSRAWRYAYFSGASAVAEEYGVCNTFRDLNDGSLSPYGEAKKEFLRFTEAFPDLGKPFVPAAVVLPAKMEMLDINFSESYLGHPISDPGFPLSAEAYREFLETIEIIFGTTGKLGNMGHVLKSGGLPGVCDIVYEDSPNLSGYDYLIDLTFDTAFSRGRNNVVTHGEVKSILQQLLPFTVDGGLFAAYNRSSNGWYALVMNNDGVFHDGFMPDVLLPEAAVCSELRLSPSVSDVRKAAGGGKLERDGGRYYLTLPAGEWALLTVA